MMKMLITAMRVASHWVLRASLVEESFGDHDGHILWTIMCPSRETSLISITFHDFSKVARSGELQHNQQLMKILPVLTCYRTLKPTYDLPSFAGRCGAG
jgi:hypothetical protein